jgi:uncharacterized membrane protein YhaH (DUF805 family)
VATIFEGRIPRETFWLANVAVFVLEVIVSALIAAAIDEFAGDRDISNGIVYAYYVVLIVYQLVLFAGRARNLNPDPAMFSLRPLFFIVLMTIVGVISLAVLIELGFRRGTPGPNRYGPDPLEKT